MDANFAIIVFLFFTISVIYSSAGFGGGSSYLAVLSLFSLEFTSIRLIALICNITVVSNSVFLFWKNGLLNFYKVWPLVILSIPLAYLGGLILINQKIFYAILTISLLLAALSMFFSSTKQLSEINEIATAGIGGGIGFLSGIVGIGGGIFLSPLLHLSRWASPKTIAASTAFFILVNSIAGIIGQVSTNGCIVEGKHIFILILAVLIGSQIGSRITINLLDSKTVKRVSAILIFLVAVRLFLLQFSSIY